MSTNRIAELRKVANLSPRQLAEHVGVNQRTVYRWETGETGVPDAHKLALADLFGVSVLWLMGWENDSNGNGERAAA